METSMTPEKSWIEIGKNLENQQGSVVVYKKLTQNEYLQEFAFIFFDNMSELMEKHRLTQTEIRLLFRLGKYLQFGNRIKVKQKLLAEELQLSTTHVSTSMKRLKQVEILIAVDGELYFNPLLFAKGKIGNYLLEESSKTDLPPTIKSTQE